MYIQTDICSMSKDVRVWTGLFVFLGTKGLLVVHVWEIEVCMSYGSNGSRFYRKWHCIGIASN